MGTFPTHLKISKFDEESDGERVRGDLCLLWNGEEVERRTNRGVVGAVIGGEFGQIWRHYALVTRRRWKILVVWRWPLVKLCGYWCGGVLWRLFELVAGNGGRYYCVYRERVWGRWNRCC